MIDGGCGHHHGVRGPLTFAGVWNEAVAAAPDQSFLTFEAVSGRVSEWTYAEFDVVVARVAKRLQDRGLAPGRGLSLSVTASPAFLAAWLAALRLGAWVVPLDPSVAPPDPSDAPHRETLVVVCSKSAGRRAPGVLAIDEDDVDLPAFGEIELGDWPVPAPMDRATMFPDGVEWSQANEVFAARTMAEAAGLGPHHRVLVLLPLTTLLARSYSVAAAISSGAHVVIASGFDANRLPEQIRRYRISHLALAAADIAAALDDRDDARALTGSLEHCWCGPALDADDAVAFVRWLGCEPRGLFGTPETVAAVLTERDDEAQPGSVGTVTPGCDAALIDARGEAVGRGEIGELVARGDAGRTLPLGARDGVVRTGAHFRRRGDDRYVLVSERERLRS